jgi:hypothetical protein
VEILLTLPLNLHRMLNPTIKFIELVTVTRTSKRLTETRWDWRTQYTSGKPLALLSLPSMGFSTWNQRSTIFSSTGSIDIRIYTELLLAFYSLHLSHIIFIFPTFDSVT